MDHPMLASPDTLWAMLPRTADVLARNPDTRAVEPSAEETTAFLTRRGLKEVPNTWRAAMRNGVGVLPVFGPVFSRMHWQRLALDFGVLMDDPSVRAIVFDFDTPGGIVTGTQEFADLVYAARGTKPITAFIAGMGASAGYWLASAADDVVIAETAEAGSIGVAALYVDWSKFDERIGIREIQIISSQSPNKNKDPATPAGLALIQARVDALADVFIDRVALQRGVARDTVLADFGQGDMIVGEGAVDAGLADRIGTFDALLAEMANPQRRSFNMTTKTSRLSAGTYQVAEDGAEPVAVAINDAFVDAHCAAIVTARVEAAVTARVDAALAERDAAHATALEAAVTVARTEARAEERTAERARFAAVLDISPVALDAETSRAIAEGESAETFAVALMKVQKDRGVSLAQLAAEASGVPHGGAGGGGGGSGDGWGSVVKKFSSKR